MTKLSACLIICILILHGCTIEKRKYSSGYHTTWNVQHLLPKGNSANQSQREESKLSFSSKLHSNSEYALFPIFSDSTKNQKSENQTVLSVTTKKKNQRLAPIVSDTVPEVKKKKDVEQNEFEPYNQTFKDEMRVRRSWLGFFSSLAGFIAGAAILWNVESIVGFALLFFGLIGLGISLTLIIAFSIARKKHHEQILWYHKLQKMAFSSETSKSKEEIYARVTEIDQKLKKLKTARLVFGLVSILTFSPLFLVGIASFILFIIKSGKRKNLKEERNILTYDESKAAFPTKKEDIDARLIEIDQKLKKLKTARLIFGLITILTILLFPIAIATFVIYLVKTGKSKRLLEERYLLNYQKSKTPNQPSVSEEEKNMLQRRFNNIMRKIRINKILIATSAIVVLMLTLFAVASGFPLAIMGAIGIFGAVLFSFITIQVVLMLKKANISDRLNMLPYKR
ncbi:MAG: hypothetical protein RLZZ71_1917 [Bacteroidota bacterium]|jgi:hypothetical protein